MLKLYRNVVMVGLVGLGLAACGDKVTITQPVTPVPGVTSVTVAPANITIAINQEVAFAASVIADAGVATSVNWSSGNLAIATVDGNGVVKGVSAGTTTIVATSTADAGKKGIASVTVSAVPPSIVSFTVTPTTAILAPPSAGPGTGGVLQATYQIVMAAGVAAPVPTWSTSNGAVATVGSDGKITAAAEGTAIITATAVSGTSTMTANVAVTVRPLVAATVSISSVTTGILTLPVVLSNVFGQIEFNLNFDPGEQKINKIAVFIGNVEAASATYVTNPAAGIITLSVNTASFTKNYTLGTATVSYQNGNSTIRAEITPVGQTVPTATQTTPIQLNNLDGWAADITKPSASIVAVGGANPGFTYWGGPTAAASATLYPVIYTPNRLVSGVTWGFGPGGTAACTLAQTATPFRSTFGTSGTTGCGYENTTVIRDNIVVTAAVDNNLNSYPLANAVTPLIPNSVVLAACSPVTTGCTLGSTPDSLRLDYVGPNTVVAPTVVGAEGFNWVNAAWTFKPGGTLVTDLGVGPKASSWTAFAGLSTGTLAVVTTGADLAETNTNTATDGYIARATATDLLLNPTNSGTTVRFGDDQTVPTIRYSAIAAPSSFAAIYTAGGGTTVIGSTVDNAIQGLYGADVVAAGANTLFLAAAAGTNDMFRTDAIDNRAGLSRAIVTSKRFAQGGTTGTTTNTGCQTTTGAFGAGLIDGYRPAPAVHITCSSALAGYYTTSETAVDRAGNLSGTYERMIALDPGQPAITGVSPNNNYTGNSSQTWSLGSQDDLEVIDGRFRILYPNVTIGDAIPTASGGLVWSYALSGTFMGTGFGAGPSSAAADANLGFFAAIAQRFDNSIVNPQVTQVTQDMFTLNVQETCLGAASPTASCLGLGDPIPSADVPATVPTTLGVQVRDVFGSWIFNSTAGAAFGVSAEFTSPILSATVATPGLYTVGYSAIAPGCPQWGGATGNPCVTSGLNFRNDGVATAAVKSFRAVEALSITLPTFTRVELYGLNAANEWVFIQRIAVPAVVPTSGSISTAGGTITGSDNGLERYWVYSFTSIPGNTFTSYRALGVNAAGFGLFSTVSL